MTRQQSSHAGLAGFGRVVLPSDIWGLIIARPVFPMLADGPCKNAGSRPGPVGKAAVRLGSNEDQKGKKMPFRGGLDRVRGLWQQ